MTTINQGPAGPFSSPAPADIARIRVEAGLTQTQAAELVYGALRTWQKWECGDAAMNPALWAFFLLRVGQHPAWVLQTR